MADVNVKNKSNQSTAMTRQESGSGVSRGRNWDPFESSLAAFDPFTSNPFSFMRRMSEEMDRAFGRFFGQSAGGGLATWYPPVEVVERDGNLQVHAELPGLKPEDVKVEVTDDALVIQGERKSEHEEKKSGVYRSERHYGQFYRAIPLPQGANPDKAKAQFNNGVLEVTLPIPESASNRRQIPIETGSGGKSSSTAPSDKK